MNSQIVKIKWSFGASCGIIHRETEQTQNNVTYWAGIMSCGNLLTFHVPDPPIPLLETHGQQDQGPPQWHTLYIVIVYITIQIIPGGDRHKLPFSFLCHCIPCSILYMHSMCICHFTEPIMLKLSTSFTFFPFSCSRLKCVYVCIYGNAFWSIENMLKMIILPTKPCLGDVWW